MIPWLPSSALTLLSIFTVFLGFATQMAAADLSSRHSYLWEEPRATAAKAASCTPGPTNLCLNSNRFRVSATWRTPEGQSGAARAVGLTPDTGYFWFFQSTNVEFVIKVINGCSISQRFWVFAGGLTNVRVDVVVEDTVTGAVKTYTNPQSTPFQPIQDTNALRGCSAGLSDAMADSGSVSAQQEAATLRRLVNDTAKASSPSLSLRQNRFRVSASWRKSTGETGFAQPVRLTDETGYFWFFDSNNVEMILKILDGCALSNRFWVFAGGLTNVAVEITVEDTATGATKTYRNPLNTAFAPIQDTGAFSTCSSDGLPPDPGLAGRRDLRGIDSDRDGVRDDLQRYIHLTYNGSAPTISALRQVALNVQDSLVASSRSEAVDLATSMTRDLECLFAVRPEDGREVADAFLSNALNTEQRGVAYLGFDEQLAGEAFPLKPIEEWNTSCSFPATNVALSQLGWTEPQGDKALCGPAKDATIFFANGMLTTHSSAVESLLTLALSSASAFPREDLQNLQFTLAYNPTFLAHDLWESVRQRLENDFSRFYRYVASLEIMPDFMANAYEAQALAVDVIAILNSPALRNHIRLYQKEILEGRKVIIVGHSQGNFFANRSYMSLSATERRSVGLVSVANPDSAVADSRPYTTLTNDRIIRLIPGALPGNTTNSSQASHDFLYHGFVTTYMVPGTASRSLILGHLKDAVDTVESPAAGAEEGIITVTLTWGEQPDVDLHVFEPGGEHVYYASRSGSSGFLDVDDVTSFGPEHYYASCSTLQAGTYRVGVNYYYGAAPEVAVIQIQAGLLIRTFEVFLPNDEGPFGNDSPDHVANILVTGDNQRGFEFQIQ